MNPPNTPSALGPSGTCGLVQLTKKDGDLSLSVSIKFFLNDSENELRGILGVLMMLTYDSGLV